MQEIDECQEDANIDEGKRARRVDFRYADTRGANEINKARNQQKAYIGEAINQVKS